VLVAQSVATDGTSLSFSVPAVTADTSMPQGVTSLSVFNPDGQQSDPFRITRLSFVANGFLPDPNGFAFTNYSPGSPDLGTFTDDFGAVEVAGSTLAAPVLTGAYFAAYCVFLGPECQGLCTGFSPASMNRFLDGETRAVDEAAQPTAALTREFTVNMGRLMSGQLLSTFLSQCNNSAAQARSTLQQIEQTWTNGATRDNMPLIFFISAGLPVSKQWFDNLMVSHSIRREKMASPIRWPTTAISHSRKPAQTSRSATRRTRQSPARTVLRSAS